jgi:hypothetical protein
MALIDHNYDNAVDKKKIHAAYFWYSHQKRIDGKNAPTGSL